MDEDNHGKCFYLFIYLFSCSSHRFAPPTSQTEMRAGMEGWRDVSQGTRGYLRTRMVFFPAEKKTKTPTILFLMTEEGLFNDEPGWQVRLPEDKRTSLHFPSH